MKWEHVRGRTSVIQMERSFIPVYYLSSQEVVFVDSGDRNSPKLFEELERRGLRVRAVLHTHLHSDHIANNAELRFRYGTQFYATPEEKRRVREQKKLTADYPVGDIRDHVFAIGGNDFQVISTPGHSSGHCAFVTPDGVCCLGDAMVSDCVISRLRLPFMQSVSQSMATMEAIRETDYPCYIMAHKEVLPRDKLDRLIDLNERKELDIYRILRGMITKPMDVDLLITEFLCAIGVKNTSDSTARFSANVRVLELVKAGECRLEDGAVLPRESGLLQRR